MKKWILTLCLLLYSCVLPKETYYSYNLVLSNGEKISINDTQCEDEYDFGIQSSYDPKSVYIHLECRNSSNQVSKYVVISFEEVK